MGRRKWPDVSGNGRREGEFDGHRTKGCDAFLVVALGRGHTFAEAAEFAGMSERTVRRRAADPEIVAAVGEYRANVIERVTARLADTLDEAVGTLRGLLCADSEAIRLRAANSLLEQYRAMWEHANFEQRLLAIEQAVEERQGADLASWST